MSDRKDLAAALAELRLRYMGLLYPSRVLRERAALCGARCRDGDACRGERRPRVPYQPASDAVGQDESGLGIVIRRP
jgi:hypothetical protein